MTTVILGELLAALYIIVTQPSYNRKLAANNNIPIPEWRMPPAIIGGVLFAIGILFFGWTGYRRDIHWIRYHEHLPPMLKLLGRFVLDVCRFGKMARPVVVETAR